MTKALAKLGIAQEGIHHRGIDDARNIAKIYQHMYSSKENKPDIEQLL